MGKRNEVGEVLRSLGVVLSQKEVSDIEDHLPKDLVDWTTFKEVAQKKPKRPDQSVAALKSAFQVFDQSGSGSIDMDEFKQIVTSLGERFSKEEFEDVCKAAGIPTVGTVHYQKILDKVAAM